MRKNVTAIILALLALSVLTLTLETQPVKADGPSYIYIRNDGSVYPTSSPIYRDGDYYTQTDNIRGGIMIERNNMTFDGNSQHIQGWDPREGIGVNVTGGTNVMLKGLDVSEFLVGVQFSGCTKCQLYHSHIHDGWQPYSLSCGTYVLNSNYTTLYHDFVSASGDSGGPFRHGIRLNGSSYCRVFNCTSCNQGLDQQDGWGILLENSSNFNNVFGNLVDNNHDGIGITCDNEALTTHNNSIRYNSIGPDNSNWRLEMTSRTNNNTITHNNFFGSTSSYANIVNSQNDTWDSGYPSYASGGNYWSDHTGPDNYSGLYQNETGGDGIVDTSREIQNTTYYDHYPLAQYNYTYRNLTIESGGNGTTDPVPEQYAYPYPGMNVTVTATADPHYQFDHWLLDNNSNISVNPTTIQVDADHTLKAVFVPQKTLTINATTGGSTTPSVGNYTYDLGTNVTVTEFPDQGYHFSYWLLDGNISGIQSWTNVTMNTDHVLTANFTSGGGGGCPYVYTWNGETFVTDNNILPASETGNGTDTTDYYKLEQPLVPAFPNPQESMYVLQVGEFETEVDYFDQTRLLAVDHAQGTSIAVTPEGEILTYTNPASPFSCLDNNGTDRLSEVATLNGNVSDSSTYFQGCSGNWLVLNFGNVTGPYANLVLRDDWKCQDDNCIEVQVPGSGGNWETADVLHPRNFWSVEAVNLSAYLPESGDFIVRLLWTATHRLDYVALDTSTPAQTQVTSAAPTLAVHSTQGDVTTTLLSDDEQCVELVNGQTLTFEFALPNNEQGTSRDFIFQTNGYYYTITP